MINTFMEVDGKSYELNLYACSVGDMYMTTEKALDLFKGKSKYDLDEIAYIDSADDLPCLSENEIYKLSNSPEQAFVSAKAVSGLAYNILKLNHYISDEDFQQRVNNGLHENAIGSDKMSRIFEYREKEKVLLSELIRSENDVLDDNYSQESLKKYLQNAVKIVNQLPDKSDTKNDNFTNSLARYMAYNITNRISDFIKAVPLDKDIVVYMLKNINSYGSEINKAIYDKKIYGDRDFSYNNLMYNPVKTGLSEFLKSASNSLSKSVFDEIKNDQKITSLFISINHDTKLSDRNAVKDYINGDIDIYDCGGNVMRRYEINEILVDKFGHSCYFEGEGANCIDAGYYYTENYPATLSDMMSLGRGDDVSKIMMIHEYEKEGFDRSKWASPQETELFFTEKLNAELSHLYDTQKGLSPVFMDLSENTRNSISRAIQTDTEGRTDKILLDFKYYTNHVNDFADVENPEHEISVYQNAENIVKDTIDRTYETIAKLSSGESVSQNNLAAEENINEHSVTR